ncbi:hypothetical protein [Bacillus thuringiensis]|uniref:Dephospho-CoA kinase n=1 Tax=Bacillus thuringiensis TaxID=1428 RepID=A0A9X6ZSX7_BACTU|nr:hypothetical protein [Bacillus thuringiensis]PFJ38852.1 hypothetical protein COJ15_17400 [Bacillus thuringiensis]
MKKRIALSGKMTTGKSTLSQVLVEQMDFQIVSIGTTIKKTSTLLIDNPPLLFQYLKQMVKENHNAQELFFSLLTAYNNGFSHSEWTKNTEGELIKNQSFRDLLQVVATTGRNLLGENVWCEFAKNEAFLILENDIPVIIDDLRIPSEKQLFEKNDFHIIRLDIEKEEQLRRIYNLYGEIDEELLNHPTETALDDACFDLRIDTTHLTVKEVSEQLTHFITIKDKNIVI